MAAENRRAQLASPTLDQERVAEATFFATTRIEIGEGNPAISILYQEMATSQEQADDSVLALIELCCNYEPKGSIGSRRVHQASRKSTVRQTATAHQAA